MLSNLKQGRMEMGEACSIHFFLLVYTELARTHINKEKKTATEETKNVSKV